MAELDEQIEFVAVLVEAQEITAVDGVVILRQATNQAMTRTLCLRLILESLARRDRERMAADPRRAPDGWW